jgi:K+-sensing histidine kinase KdpD/putative methionine-R-sulfoxide reductase with GAF domain
VSLGLLLGNFCAWLALNFVQPVRWEGDWPPILLFSVTLAAVNNLDLIFSTSYASVAHLIPLTAFLATGLTQAMWVVVAGSLASEALKQFLGRQTTFTDNAPLEAWRQVSASIKAGGLGLCLMGLVYQKLGGSVATLDWGWRDLLALVILFGGYFLVYNVLYVSQVYPQRESISHYFQRNLWSILRLRLFTLPCAAILANFYLRLSAWPFFFSGGALIVIRTLAYYIVEMRRNLAQQSRERHILNKVGQVLATTSMEVDVLLNTLYHQIRQLMDASHFYVALYDEARDTLTFPVLIEGGKRKHIADRRAGNGLTEYVIRQRKPILIPENAAHVIANLGLEVIGEPALSWLGVPLPVGDKVLGVMTVQSFSRTHAYSQRDLSLLSTLASQAAIALENAQLYGQMRRRAAEMALLNTVSTAVNSTLDIEQVLQIVVTSIMPIMFCQKAALYLLDEPDGQLQLQTSQGLDERSKKSLVQQNEQRFQRVRDQNIVIVPDVSRGKLSAAEMELAQEAGYRAFAEILLVAQNDPIGMLGVYYDQVHYLDLAERDLLVTFANQVATAIDNARLYSQTDQALARRVDELSAIERIGRELTSTLEPKLVIDLVLEQAMRATNATQGYIAMSDTVRQRVNIVTQHGYAPQFALGNELVERVLRDGQLALVRDVQPDTALIPASQTQLTVPILSEGTVMGAINLGSAPGDGFDDQDADFVSQLATQAAVALKNAQLFQERSQRVEELSLLYQASLALASRMEYADILDIISRLARHITNSDTVTLYLYHAAEDRFERATSQGYRDQETLPATVRRQGMTRRIIETQQPVLVLDTLEHKDINPQVLKRQVRSIIGVPVMSQGQALGVLYIYHHEPHAYSENDVRLIGALANQAGTTMANAELFNQISQAHDRLEAIINSTRDGILVLDNSGRVVIANARMGLFSELRRGQLVGQTVDDLIEQYPVELTNLLGIPLQESGSWKISLLTNSTETSSRTFKIPATEGEPGAQQHARPRFTEMFSTPVLDNVNQVMGRLMVFRDITEEKELEQMREDLTGMMVHDLRSPLAAVLSGLEMIQELAVDPSNDPLAEEAMRVAKRSCNRMLTLVSSLLDINQLESGKMPLRRAPAPFAPLARSAASSLSPLATERGITLNVELPPGLPMVEIDNEKIGRVLINILDNALKFTPDGEEITLRAVHENGERGNVLLASVRDAGPGIPHEYKEKVFDRFAQVHGQVAPRGPRGSGLGLAFCKLAVEAHDGRIWVENEPGQGCTFYFTLPVVEIEGWLEE